MDSRKIEGWRARLAREAEQARSDRIERISEKRRANSSIRSEVGNDVPESRFSNVWERKRDWYRRNREDVLRSHKAWRDANPDKVRAWVEAWSERNPEARREISKRYRERNPKTDHERLVHAIYRQLRYLSDKDDRSSALSSHP